MLIQRSIKQDYLLRSVADVDELEVQNPRAATNFVSHFSGGKANNLISLFKVCYTIDELSLLVSLAIHAKLANCGLL